MLDNEKNATKLYSLNEMLPNRTKLTKKVAMCVIYSVLVVVGVWSISTIDTQQKAEAAAAVASLVIQSVWGFGALFLLGGCTMHLFVWMPPRLCPS